MEILFSLLTLAGIGYAMYRGIKWLMRSSQSALPREEPLTPRDLKVLEEAAARLIAEMKAAAESSVAKLEMACDRAEGILAERSRRITDESSQAPPADSSGLLTGEMELVKGLQQIASS